jgi:SpoVK/Ycf46/Vps4 family AAA+-type ATPase
MCDDALLQLMQTMTMNPSILLLEDVDAAHTAVARREPEKDDSTDPGAVRGAGWGGEGGSESGGAGGPEETAATVSADKAMMLHLLEQSRADGQHRDREREREREEKKGRLTLSGLLNALDGPTATSGRLLFMTTNRKSNIDSALLRSGRIDYELRFDAVTPSQCERIFTRFYCDYSAVDDDGKAAVPDKQLEVQEMAGRFAKEVGGCARELSAADVQGHLMRHKKDPAGALRRVGEELLHQQPATVVGVGDRN